jgi:signal transduction histidine kinase
MLFIGLGMFLIDLVLGLMSYRQVVKSEMIQAKATLSAIVQQIQSSPLLAKDHIHYVNDLANITRLGIVMVDASQESVYQFGMDDDVAAQLLQFTKLNIAAAGVEKKFYGGYFGLLGLQYNHLFLAHSLQSVQGISLGAVGVDVPLYTFFQSIWQGQRLVWVYIFFNLFVLTGLAYWRFSRFLIVPLQQVAEKAASYQDDDFYLTSDFQTDDVSKLSRSLDQMFRRIHNDRDELQKMVTTLEELNESLTQAQSDVIRAEKLASVGRLSAGIAHEIGNPLGIVLGYLELLKGNDITETERLDFITRAMEEIQRINKIIRELLDLARPVETGGEQSSVHMILESFKDDLALQAVMGGMQLYFDLAAENDTVEMDSEKLHQVFLNLILNGADAVKGQGADGEMHISTSCIYPDVGKLPSLEIRFADNGSGIDPDHLKQVFDPFFTTKEVGKGTGLGLSVSYMIIENGGGEIQVSSGDRQGTEFRIVLPLVQ